MPCDNFDRSHFPGEPEPFPLSGNLCHTCKNEQRMHGDETTENEENDGAEQAEVEVNIRFTPALWNTVNLCKWVHTLNCSTCRKSIKRVFGRLQEVFEHVLLSCSPSSSALHVTLMEGEIYAPATTREKNPIRATFLWWCLLLPFMGVYYIQNVTVYMCDTNDSCGFGSGTISQSPKLLR